jgi:hypothetical protein
MTNTSEKSDANSTPNRSSSHHLLITALLVHFGLLFFAVFVIYVRGTVFGEPFPLNTFLPAPVTRFGDFFGNHYRWRLFQFDDVSYAGAYFPAIYIFVDLITSHTASPYTALKIFLGAQASLTIVLLLVWSFRVRHRLTGVAIAVIYMTSYPTLFMLHTGNLEGLVFLFVLGSVMSKSFGHHNRSVFLLGIAVAMKFYPIVFLPFILLQIPRRHRLLVTTKLLATSAVATLLALVTLPGGLLNGFGVFQRIRESQHLYKELMVIGDPGTNFGHSLLNGVHAIFGSGFLSSQHFWIPMLVVLLLSTATLSLLLDHFASEVDVFVLCAVIGCLFAPTSTDYKLLYFFPVLPLVLLCGAPPRRMQSFLLVATLLIIAPKPWGVLERSPYFNAGVWLTPILMTVVLVVLVVSTFLIGRHREHSE